MKLHPTTLPLCTFAALLLAAVNSWPASLPWSQRYTIQPGIPTSGLFGTIYAQPAGGSGFVLLGASQETFSGESRLVSSLGRFDDSGKLLWSALLDGGTGSSDPRLNAPNNSNLLQAAYLTDSDSIRFGIYQGTNLAKRFAVEIPVFEPEFDEIIADHIPQFLDNGETALVELGDSKVKVTILNDTGTKSIDKIYESTTFGNNSQFSFIPPTSAIGFDRFPDNSGYLLTVSISIPEFLTVPPFSFSYDNVTTLLRLDNGGSLRWARTFTMNNTGGEVSGTSWVGPDGQILVVLSETTALTGLSEDTHILRLSSQGALTWARTLQDTALDIAHVVDGNVWLFGSTGNRSDVRCLRLNELTGAIAAQATLDSGGFDIGAPVDLVDGRILFAIQSAPSTANNPVRDALTVSLDSNLQNPVARKYHKTVGNLTMSYHAASRSVIFSPFESANGTIDVVSLTTGFSPVTDCDLFSDTTISVANSGVTSAVLSIAPSEPSVTVVNANTVMTPTEIALQAVNLNKSAICGNTGTPTAPRLTLVPANGGGFEIRFNSESGVNYEVRSSLVVDGAYNTIIATLQGTGAGLTYKINSAASGTGYYLVRAVRP